MSEDSDRELKNKAAFAQQIDPNITRQNVLEDVFGLDIPVETIPLPSQGLTYEKGTALNDSRIDIRPMTSREEDILTSASLIKKGTVLSSLLESCILTKGVDVRQMLSGDRNTLMIALRITGYGSEYTAEVKCGECDQKEKYKFNLSSMPIKRLTQMPVQENTNLFEISLPVTKKAVRFKLMTGWDEENMSQEREQKKKLGLPTDNAISTKLKYHVVAVEGKKGFVTDKNLIGKFIESMPARDSLTLRTQIDKIEPGIEMSGKYTCTKCGTTDTVDIPLGSTFFWPDE